jgi:hypothetical protein
MRRVLRLAVGMLAVLSVAMVGMAAGVGSQDDQGGTASYLPDADVRGLPASKYRVVFAEADCKLDVSNNPLITGGLSAIPGVGGLVDKVVPDIGAPSVLCPSELAKDGLGRATSGAWSAGVYVISVLTDGVEALLSFDIGALLAPLVGDIADKMDARVAGRLQLRHFAIAAAGIVVAFMFLTGRLGRAMGELLAVIIALGVATLLLSNLTGAYRAMSDFGREASTAGLSIAGEDNAAQPLDSIREALIWDQWQAQPFGAELPPECADAAFAALRDDHSVIKAVEGAGCGEAAENAAKSSWGRLFAAIAYLLLALFVAWSLVKLAIGIALGQAALALGFVFAPIACALAPMRGGRTVFGAWLGTLVRAVAGMVFSALLLAITVLAFGAILQAPWSPFFRLAVAAGTAFTLGRLTGQWLSHLEASTQRGTSRAVVGGVAVGAGIGAGAVAAQGIVSSSHQRADLLAGQARQRSVRTFTRASGTATETGRKVIAATPPAKSIQERREARHGVAHDEHRQRVAAEMDARKDRSSRRSARLLGRGRTPTLPADPVPSERRVEQRKDEPEPDVEPVG